MRKRLIGLMVAAWMVPTAAWAAEYEISPGEDVEAAMAMLQAGDELVLRDGMYTVQGRFSVNLVGTSDSPILIRAADGETPHIHRADASENLIDLDVAEYVEFRGIEFSGGSAGIRMSDVRNVTIRGCDIHDTGDVAVRANDGGAVYEQLHIVGNNIHDTNNTGEGMYLGCNENACQVQDSIIELNWVHHTNGPTIEQGDGIELKEGSFSNIIRHNVIHDTNYPCILVYATTGNGERNTIDGNVMWNCGDHGIQAAADAIIRNNIILSVGSNGIGLQPHQSGAPSELTVVHNTIVIPSGNAIGLSGATGIVTLANNAVFAMGGSAISINGDTSNVTVAGNVGMGGFGGEGYVDGNLDADFDGANWSGGPPVDVFPAAAGSLVGAADVLYTPPEDFNGLPHNSPPDVGAYAFARGGNPGWTIAAEFKEFPPEGSDSDSDTGDESGSDTDPDSDSGPATSGDMTDGSDSDESADGTQSGGASGNGSGGTSATTTFDTDTDPGAGSDDDGGGCNCDVDRSNSRQGVGVMLLGLLGLTMLRRQRPTR